MPLTASQMKYLALAWQCFDSEPKIDYEKFALVAGLASAASAREIMRVTKKKLKEEYGGDDGKGARGDGDGGLTAKGNGKGAGMGVKRGPKKEVGKGAVGRKKGKDDVDGEEGGREESDGEAEGKRIQKKIKKEACDDEDEFGDMI